MCDTLGWLTAWLFSCWWRRGYFCFVFWGLLPQTPINHQRLHPVKETFQPFHAAAEFNAMCFFPWAQKHISACNNLALKSYCLPSLKTKVFCIVAQSVCQNLSLKCSFQKVFCFSPPHWAEHWVFGLLVGTYQIQSRMDFGSTCIQILRRAKEELFLV